MRKLLTSILIIINVGFFLLISYSLINRDNKKAVTADSETESLDNIEVPTSYTNIQQETDYLIITPENENVSQIALFTNDNIFSIEFEIVFEDSEGIIFTPSENFNIVLQNEYSGNTLSVALSNLENNIEHFEYSKEGGIVIGTINNLSNKFQLVTENSNYTNLKGVLININEIKSK